MLLTKGSFQLVTNLFQEVSYQGRLADSSFTLHEYSISFTGNGLVESFLEVLQRMFTLYKLHNG